MNSRVGNGALLVVVCQAEIAPENLTESESSLFTKSLLLCSLNDVTLTDDESPLAPSQRRAPPFSPRPPSDKTLSVP